MIAATTLPPYGLRKRAIQGNTATLAALGEAVGMDKADSFNQKFSLLNSVAKALKQAADAIISKCRPLIKYFFKLLA